MGEFVGVGPYRGFVLVEFESDGRKFLLKQGEPLSEGSVFPLSVRSSRQTPTLAFGSAFLIWFSTVDTVLCTVRGR